MNPLSGGQTSDWCWLWGVREPHRRTLFRLRRPRIRLPACLPVRYSHVVRPDEQKSAKRLSRDLAGISRFTLSWALRLFRWHCRRRRRRRPAKGLTRCQAHKWMTRPASDCFMCSSVCIVCVFAPTYQVGVGKRRHKVALARYSR